MWYGRSFGKMCYLTGGMSASKCEGATMSEFGPYYYTKDREICEAAESKLMCFIIHLLMQIDCP